MCIDSGRIESVGRNGGIDMNDLIFCYGALADDFGTQANKQGYTLGKKAEMFNKMHKAYNMLRIHGCLTDGEADRVCNRIQKKLIASLVKLEKEEE